MAKVKHKRASLYRIFDANGELMYIGYSLQVLKRTQQHESEKPWFWGASSISIEWFDSKRDALSAEALAIATEKPKWNIQHNRTPVQKAKKVSPKRSNATYLLAAKVTPEEHARAHASAAARGKTVAQIIKEVFERMARKDRKAKETTE